MATQTAPGADVLDDEIEGFDADALVTEDPENDAPEDATADGEQENDPLASLKAELLDEIRTEYGPLKALDPNKLLPAIGRIGKLQSDYEKLSKVNPTAEIDPRLDATESLNRAVAQALISNDLVDDQSKQSLRDALSSLDGASSKREREAMKRELLEEIQGATASTQDNPAPEIAPEWLDAEQEIKALADASGIAHTDIPWADAQATGSPVKALRYIENWAKARATPAAADRVDERKRAAGGGSPSRAGAASSIERDLERLANGEVPQEDEATRKRLAAELGVDL